MTRLPRGCWVCLLLGILACLVGPGHAEFTRDTVLEYRQITDATPWSIHVVTFDLARPELDLIATVGMGVYGSEPVALMAEHVPAQLGRPITAVNGDYFEFLTEPRYRGTLQGLTVSDGEMLSGPAGYAFWIDAQRQPHLDRVQGAFTVTWPDGTKAPFGLNCSTSDYNSEVRAADLVLYTPAFGPSTNTEGGREYVLVPEEPREWLPLAPYSEIRGRVSEVNIAGNTPIPPGRMVLTVARKADDRAPALQPGDVVTLTTALTPDLHGVRNAVSGDPLLLAGGKVLPNLDNTARHPRTAVGFAGTRCWLVVVDGRQPTRSVGMSHQELAELMWQLGCTDALNLDGGGSSTFWYQGSVVNAPAVPQPRPVGNGLVLVRKE